MKNSLFETSQKVALVGLGRLQLGLIGPAYFKMGYELVGINFENSGSDLIDRLNEYSKYKVIHNDSEGLGYDISISESYDYTKDQENALSAISKATVLNFAMGQSQAAIDRAASFLVDLEMYRRERGIVDILFVTCSDNPAGQEFGIDRILRKFFVLLNKLDDDLRERLFNDMSYHVRFIRTLADKICTHMIISDNKKEPVKILAEDYSSIIYDRAYIGTQPLLLDTKKSPEVGVSDNLELDRQRKFFTISMSHSIASYLGFFCEEKPKYIVDSLEIKDIDSSIRRALEEVAEAFAVKSGQSISEWKDYSISVFERLQNKEIEDELPRVARDVKRKLRPEDRLFGPLILIYETLFRINMPLVNAISCALLYAEFYDDKFPAFEQDPNTVEISEKIKESGIRSVLEESFQPRNRYAHLDVLLNAIEERYNDIKSQLSWA